MTFLSRNLLFLHLVPAQDVSAVLILIIHHPSQANNLAPFLKLIVFKPFCPRTGLTAFWSVFAQIADTFQRNSFTCGKPEFTNTIFPIILVTS